MRDPVGPRMTSGADAPLDGLPGRRVRFVRGQVIYDEGEPTGTMFRLESGCVRLQVNGEDGDRQIVSFLFPGDLFGFCLDQRNTAAEAVSEVEVTRFAVQMILEMGAARPEIIVALINRANGLYGDLARHVEKVTHLPADERLLWFFNWLIRQDGAHASPLQIALPMNYRDIADFLSLKPETLSRAMKKLEAEGYLTRRGRRGLVLRRPAMPVPVRMTDRLVAGQYG